MNFSTTFQDLFKQFQGFYIKQYLNALRLIYNSEASGEGDRSVHVRCLSSCVNQMKETEAETAAVKEAERKVSFFIDICAVSVHNYVKKYIYIYI